MRKTSLIILYLLTLQIELTAQNTAVEYMEQLGEIYLEISRDTWDYIKQAARGKNAAKIEKRRLELANTLKLSKSGATKMGTYQGDPSLRDATVSYLTTSYAVINNDYQDIVDLERISEESYDAMEIYLTSKEKANAKMDSIYDQLKASEEAFAAKNNITLTTSNSKLTKKLNNASVVSAYSNKIYLIFYKAYWYEQQMIQAQYSGKISDVEQYRQSLESSAIEGMDQLKTLGLFRNDRSLKEACNAVLSFYQSEATRYMPKQIDFYLMDEKMNTTIKNFQAKNKNSLTQKDIDEYNNAISENNQAVKNFNSTNEYLNKTRNDKINSFNYNITAFHKTYL